jgi:flavodoxin
MRVLVAYMSKTGNTRKVAEAIFGEIVDGKEIERIEDVVSLEDYDIAFLGFPVHGQRVEKKVADLLAKHCVQGRNIALFVTHGSREGNVPELQHWLAEFNLAASGANIVGMFNCQGQLAKAVKFVMSMHPNANYRAWVKMDTSQGQPDEARLDKARAFSRQVMKTFHEMKNASIGESGNRMTAAALV